MTKPTCTLPECDKPSRSNAQALCPMHYHRAYRHGDVNKVAHHSNVTVSNGRRYKTRGMKHHPLASKHGIVYVHRQVLFDNIGEGPHQCHWCNTTVQWFLDKNDPQSLHVDHLNDIGDDNRPENLAASCRRCNGGRGAQRRADALREAGYWSSNDTIAALHNPRQRRAARIVSQAH